MTDTGKFLIVGLGNPGREHKRNRHNVGFMVLDRLAGGHGLAFTRRQSRALVATVRLGGASAILAKPQTYMNLSGEAAASLLRFYDLPLDHLLVCFDDIDLPVGAIRIRPEGGSAGHNGMKSLIERLGTQAFPRLRVGVGRPSGQKAAAAYVLRDFTGEDAEIIAVTLDRAAEAVECFAAEGILAAMNRYNGPMEMTNE